jgi:parallel beta-helix repeat protein
VNDWVGDGIRLDGAPGSTLAHNVCDNNGWNNQNGGAGIFLTGSPNCTVDHNHTGYNFHGGIGMQFSENCVVTGNEANNNFGNGIYVWGWCCGSIFERNVAEDNQYDLVAADWNGADPECNMYEKNHADTAFPDLATWDATSKE